MIKAVFFDLYGTLAGFSPSRYVIQSQACADFGIEVTPEGVLKGYALADAYMAEQNAVRPLRGLSFQERGCFFAGYERRVLQGAGVHVTTEEAGRIWQRVRQEPCQLACFDDVLPAMDILKAQALILGMISNMNHDGAELREGLGLTSYLDFAVTSGEVGWEKPHAPIFLAALERAGVEPHEAVHVGDQLNSDIDGARGVGVNPVLLDRDGNHRDFQWCPRIESLIELPGLLSAYRAG